ncbi:MAG TPA: cupin domain-containing protein [Pyrinomonadaceae bacterium]|nr:cupin domain-containing protein [Pyrinomonadaceae bacterium]
MALLTILDKDRTLTDGEAIAEHLAPYGINYERWLLDYPLDADAPTEEILDAYSQQIEQLKAHGGYITADVIDVRPKTPGLEEMLAKFNREHWHDEDEVRFIISGHGLFHIRPEAGSVVSIEVEAGDLIRVPRSTWHWFNLCADRRIRAIRLFQDVAGWTPHYTDSGADKKFLPVCFGPSYLPHDAWANLAR